MLRVGPAIALVVIVMRRAVVLGTAALLHMICRRSVRSRTEPQTQGAIGAHHRHQTAWYQRAKRQHRQQRRGQRIPAGKF